MILKVIFRVAILSTLTLTLPCRAVPPYGQHGGAYSGGIRDGDIVVRSSSHVFHGEILGTDSLPHEVTSTKGENVKRGVTPEFTSFLADPASEALPDV